MTPGFLCITCVSDMKKPKIFVLVKNFDGVNQDVDVYGSFKEAKREFREYTGFGFNKSYCDPHSEKYHEKLSETKIFELDLPGFLEIRKGVPSHEKRQR